MAELRKQIEELTDENGKKVYKTKTLPVTEPMIQKYVDLYGEGNRDAIIQALLTYHDDPFLYTKNMGFMGLDKYMKNQSSNWAAPNATTPTAPTTPAAPTTNAPGDTTTGQSATEPTNPDTASTSGVQQTNSQADALSNNVNEGENKAKQTMTVQSGSDMGGVNYTNAGGKSTTSTASSEGESVMPTESATPTNQKYSNWASNASTFGTSDENEKKAPLTLTKTVYWARRKH